MVIIVLLCTFFIVLWINFLWSRRKYYAFALKMPGPLGLPFIGIGHKVFKSSESLYQLGKYALQYNVKTYFTWLGPYPLLYTIDPKIAEVILNSPDCLNRTVFMDVLKDMFGDGLLTSKAPTWNTHRRLINPFFNYKVLLEFLPKFNKVAHELCEKLDNLVGCGEVDLSDLLSDMTIKSTLETTMGIDSRNSSIAKLKACYARLQVLTIERALNPLLINSTLYRFSSKYKSFKECSIFINNFVQKLVMNKLTSIETKASVPKEESVDIKKRKVILIDQAVKVHQRNEFTINDVVNECNLFVFAAFESSATAVLSCLMVLAMHPEIQERVFEEIISVFPDKDFDVSNTDIKDLTYLDMCINETLRVLSVIPIHGRVCNEDIHISKDLVVPKGTQIAIDIFNMNRDEGIWGPTAKTFDPDHCLPANLANMPKNSFMPFSMGPRNCIGWQFAKISLKVSLSQCLRRYRFSTKYRFEDLICMPFITMKYETVPLFEIHRR